MARPPGEIGEGGGGYSRDGLFYRIADSPHLGRSPSVLLFPLPFLLTLLVQFAILALIHRAYAYFGCAYLLPPHIPSWCNALVGGGGGWKMGRGHHWVLYSHLQTKLAQPGSIL